MAKKTKSFLAKAGPNAIAFKPTKSRADQPTRRASDTQLVRVIWDEKKKKYFAPDVLKVPKGATMNIVFVLENAPPNAQLYKIDIVEKDPPEEIAAAKRRLETKAKALRAGKQMANGKRVTAKRELAAREGDLHPFSFPMKSKRVMLLTDDNSMDRNHSRSFTYSMQVKEGSVFKDVDPEIVNEPPPR